LNILKIRIKNTPFNFKNYALSKIVSSTIQYLCIFFFKKAYLGVQASFMRNSNNNLKGRPFVEPRNKAMDNKKDKKVFLCNFRKDDTTLQQFKEDFALLLRETKRPNCKKGKEI